MDILDRQTVPLTFNRFRLGQPVSGLTVTVQVTNNLTNAVLLPTTVLPETAAGSGVYGMNWAHGLTQDTQCLARYTVGSNVYPDVFLISFSGFGGRGA